MAVLTASALALDMSAFDLSGVLDGTVIGRSSALFSTAGGGIIDTFTGQIGYDGLGYPVSGVITGYNQTVFGQFFFSITNTAVPVPTLVSWVLNGQTATALTTIFGGADQIFASSGDDLLSAFAGADYVEGRGGADSVLGGEGADTIYGGAGNDLLMPEAGGGYIRGEDGNDTIIGGGGGFEDLHGNAGDDSLRGGADSDWVVGGKDNDQLHGEAGHDIVYGNLGNDTCTGGDWNDIVRGGQQNDTISGGSGDDWLSGDKDADTISGGLGADVFHTFGEAGLDLVLDFNRAEGDRVQLDPGTTYVARQVGADVVIDMNLGGQMILQNVQLASLTEGWIFTL